MSKTEEFIKEALMESFIDGIIAGVDTTNIKLAEAGLNYKIKIPSKQELTAMYHQQILKTISK